jgi:hypothetical protein
VEAGCWPAEDARGLEGDWLAVDALAVLLVGALLHALSARSATPDRSRTGFESLMLALQLLVFARRMRTPDNAQTLCDS